MAYLMGEQIQIGVGREGTRGTAVAPQAWIPARTPTGISTVTERATIRETRGTGIMSQGVEIVNSRAEGDLEFNVRNTSIGYILASLLGAPVSAQEGSTGAYTHTFTRQTSGPQFPSLTLGLSQAGTFQDYQYPLGVVNSLELRTPVDDLVNATVNFVAKQENEVSAYTPAFDETADILFRNHDIIIKIANDVSGLDAATGICLKELTLNIANNTRPNVCIGGANPSDIFSLITEITGSFVADYEDSDYYDIFKEGTYKAMRITMERDDLPVLGTASTLYPLVQIDLPKVSFEGYTPDRPIDDIVMENIEFTAHYDTDEAEAITVLVHNEQATYAAA